MCYISVRDIDNADGVEVTVGLSQSTAALPRYVQNEAVVSQGDGLYF